MRESPILFSGPMVRAILEDRKTQARRIVKPQPTISGGIMKVRYERHPFSESALAGTPGSGHGVPDQMAWVGYDWVENPVGIEPLSWIKCPYGQPGDRLWVRESWAKVPQTAYWHDQTIPHQVFDEEGYKWWAIYREGWERSSPGWTPSIHMPRWASRILLEVVSVRVERLNDINEADAIAEGLAQTESGMWLPGVCESPVWAFRELWESINGKGSWAENPWVWVIEFKVIQP